MTADTMTKDQTIALQAAEIENLRARVYYVSPGSPFAPEGITWQQEANRLFDALADEQELRLGPR